MSSETAAVSRSHHRTCNLCEAMCGIIIDLEKDESGNERIKKIYGDKNDPLSKGHICPKAIALQDIWADPDRLRLPIRKTEGGWKQISWDEAFDLTAQAIRSTWEKHGRDAVATYHGNPNIHNLGSMISGRTLIKMLRSKNRYSATSVDQLPQHIACKEMFGHMMLVPIPDLERTDFFLVIGANPMASNGSMMTTGGIDWRLKELRARGGKLVVVDPRKTETARVSDEHLFIKPGTDAFLLLAIINTLLSENLAKLGRLSEISNGLDNLPEIVEEWKAERVAELTGISADQIKTLARNFAAASSAVAYGRIGISVQKFGGLCQWLINVLNVITGNLDREGGAMFTNPAIELTGQTSAGKSNRWKSRVRGIAEQFGELPVSVLAEEILESGEGQIKSLITVAGNPVLSTPDGSNLEKALESLDFMVSVDIYLNETTRHADLIIPPTTGLEVDHYDLTFHSLAVRNTSKFSEALFEPAEGAKHDYEIFREISKRLSTDERPFNEGDPVNVATPAQILDYMLQMGPEKLTVQKLKDNPSGVDLGPLKQAFPGRLLTESGKIELTPESIVADLARLADSTSDDVSELTLIGRRDLRTNNSWMHNSERLVKGPVRCTLYMNPKDAEKRDVSDGQIVTVRSRVGEVEIPTKITEDVMPGVVCMPHDECHQS